MDIIHLYIAFSRESLVKENLKRNMAKKEWLNVCQQVNITKSTRVTQNKSLS